MEIDNRQREYISVGTRRGGGGSKQGAGEPTILD